MLPRPKRSISFRCFVLDAATIGQDIGSTVANKPMADHEVGQVPDGARAWWAIAQSTPEMCSVSN